jgi:cytochrome c oxidase cbb3-type subunit 2
MTTPPAREFEWQEEYHAPMRSLVAATVVVAAVYTYFLGFGQLAFVRAVTAALPADDGWLRSIFAAFAVCGMAGGWGAARLFTPPRARLLMTAGLAGAAVAAGLTWMAAGPILFLLIAILAGSGLGFATVTLIGMLRRETGGVRLGTCLGVGTGVAYGLCNLPVVFAGQLATQLLVAIGAAGAGIVAVQGFEQRAPAVTARGPDYTPAGVRRWIALFLVLVVTDTAAFFIIQQNPGLRQATWATSGQLNLNAGVHALAAIVAGLALDRRRVVATLATSALLLVAAIALLGAGVVNATVAALYVAGVSGYSTVLVFYPARAGRPGLAAALYAIAGWLGSGLGLGLGAGLGQLTPALPLAAGAIVAALLATRPRK